MNWQAFHIALQLTAGWSTVLRNQPLATFGLPLTLGSLFALKQPFAIRRASRGDLGRGATPAISSCAGSP